MSEERYQSIGNAFAEKYQTESSKMFGKPCLKVNKKAFAAFFKGEMVFKLGQNEVNILKEKYAGSVNWDPSGKNRAMKDWLQVPDAFSGDWEELAQRAMEYVETN